MVYKTLSYEEEANLFGWANKKERLTTQYGQMFSFALIVERKLHLDAAVNEDISAIADKFACPKCDMQLLMKWRTKTERTEVSTLVTV